MLGLEVPGHRKGILFDAGRLVKTKEFALCGFGWQAHCESNLSNALNSISFIYSLLETFGFREAA